MKANRIGDQEIIVKKPKNKNEEKRLKMRN